MMLRTAVLAVGVLTALAGATLLLLGRTDGGAQLLAIGALVTIATAFERWRYRKQLPVAGRWERTGERFEDPATGQPMEVLYDPASGERRYEPLTPQ
ncbi:MAG: hypothetical protein ACYCUE_05840 [Steroidobacteraceae bacterium]